MRKLLSAVVFALAAVLLLINPGGTVHAQSTGLGITPRKDLVINPGKTVTDKLYIANLDTKQTLTLNLQVIDFGSKDETGTPALRLSENATQTSWSLRPFLKAPEKLVLKPGETQYVSYSVTIPEKQGAGSYYSAIRYAADSANGGNVSISASGATLVFVTVPGLAKESLVLQKFGAYKVKPGSSNGSYSSFFMGSKPEKLAFTVKNDGNVAEQPAGSILIKNMFGKQYKLVKDMNSKASLALIGQTRRFETCIVERANKADDESEKSKLAAQGQECEKPSLMPGRYTATLAAFYGINGGQTHDIAATASFWYLPTWFLLLLLAIVAALVFGGWMLYRRFAGGRSFSRRRS